MPETLLDEALVSLEDAKVYLRRETDDTDDEVITRTINYATGQIERYCARRLVNRAYDDTNDSWLIAHGTGTSEIIVSEWPVTSLDKVEELNDDGTVARELDLTGHRMNRAGVIWLPRDTFSLGERNIRVSCEAGIVPSSADGKALAGIALRWIQTMFGDYQHGAGRNQSVTAGGQTISFNYRMPDDIKDALRPFVRVL